MRNVEQKDTVRGVTAMAQFGAMAHLLGLPQWTLLHPNAVAAPVAPLQTKDVCLINTDEAATVSAP